MSHFAKAPKNRSSRLPILLLLALLFLLSIYLNWHIGMKQSFVELSKAAKKASDQLDVFISDLLQDSYILPTTAKELTHCKSDLLAAMERIAINNPVISGLILSDSFGQSICSTLPKRSYSLALASQSSRAITGPYQMPLFLQPTYLIQQKMGTYRIGVVLISSVLEKILNPHAHIVSQLILYNSHEKKPLMQLDFAKIRPKAKASGAYAKEAVHSIHGLEVIVFPKRQIILYHLLWRQLIANSLLFAFVFLSYFLIKSILIRHYSLQKAMKDALKNEAFYPVYHPIFNSKTRTYVGAEVLLRWQLNPDETIMPDAFIKEAESSGLIVPITISLIKKVFREKLQNPLVDFHFAFNLSVSHFKEASFFETFYQLAKQYAVMPHEIIFEITERELLDKNNPIFLDKMQELRKKGYSLAIDDFGTGHASISYLQHFPFNYLKIDKLFVQAIGTHAITESLNETIVEMAKKLHLILVAEGVETKEQADYLSQHGIRLQQGWFYTRELSFENLSKLMNGG